MAKRWISAHEFLENYERHIELTAPISVWASSTFSEYPVAGSQEPDAHYTCKTCGAVVDTPKTPCETCWEEKRLNRLPFPRSNEGRPSRADRELNPDPWINRP